MKQYRVTLEGDAREVYVLFADSAEDARENWSEGWLEYTELSGMEVVDVSLDKEGSWPSQ